MGKLPEGWRERITPKTSREETVEKQREEGEDTGNGDTRERGKRGSILDDGRATHDERKKGGDQGPGGCRRMTEEKKGKVNARTV